MKICFLSLKKQILLPYSDKTGQKNMHIHVHVITNTRNFKHVHNRKADHGCKKAGKYLNKNAFD